MSFSRARLCFLLFVSLTTTSALHAAPWELAWSDEFNYEGPPDKTKWGYEEGFLRNRELQYYTKERKENARVENGMLVIEGRRERFPILPSAPDSNGRAFADYTSASLVTLNKASWQYGRIEVRAKLPRGRGVWPAIWMLGADISKAGWPACGEIDIMEFVGKEPQFIHGTVHYAVDGKHQSSGNKLAVSEPFAGFHVYSTEWTPEQIVFFVDGQKYHSFAVGKAGEGAENPFRKPQYLILNLALGGDWGGLMDDSILPQQFLIDYVRVYKRKGE